ncbi:MAG: hybrid sensor histidine kinase/response regulator [Alcanivorax sp.]|nr:hybrid sensor histidine kinase/response regulator [Alcanivorax sp.]MAY09383.1 hybrid sensor histidine kinase/response regulator [Alcanivorax sp.]MBI56170.1 hybrid sensor histidine kinase/response regulator [Alcanivorax sp.]MBU58326.1 hybrid sensor histidine kinase/response regulator [Alcanivorax sp.]
MNIEDRFQIERLTLVLRHLRHAFSMSVMVATLMVAVFYFSSDSVVSAVSAISGERIGIRTAAVSTTALLVWYFALLAVSGAQSWGAHRALQDGFGAADVPRIRRQLVLGRCLEGTLWGALIWIGIDQHTSPGATALLMGLLASSNADSVAKYSNILGLYTGIMLPMTVLAVGRFITIDDLYYRMMAGFCVLFVIAQYLQARTLGGSINEAIRLRFENLDLVERLKTETHEASTAREAAEQADEDKSRFLAAASHDLRQPVQALQLLLETLSWSELDERQRHTLDSARAASESSSEMLNALLDFSRLEAGVIEPRPRPLSLQQLFRKLEMELAPMADEKGLVYRTRDTEATVVSDPALLELILRNLVANAIRYTDRGGVLVACRRRGAGYLIEVYDTGVGIAPDQHRAIFREFHQLGNPERDRRKGLGLGLATAERLATALTHALTLRSIPGRGSVFRLRVGGAERQGTPSTRASAAPSSLPNLGGRRVLVIDDDETIRHAMRLLLTGWGCECRTAASLEEALHQEAAAPALILCDYRLREGRNGTEAIACLRTHFGADIPALLVTGDTAPSRLREASASGIPLLHKPVAALALHQALVAALDGTSDRR